MSKSSSTDYSSDSSDYCNDVINLNLLGKCIHNNFIITKHLGSGSYADVWKTYLFNDFFKLKKGFYAIKIHNKENFDIGIHEENMLKFLKYRSHHIVKLLKSFITYYCGMKLHCQIFPLYDGNILDISLSSSDIKYILKGIKILHDKNIIHGDIKPENILYRGKIRDINNYELYLILNYNNILDDYINNYKTLHNKTNIKNIERNHICEIVYNDIVHNYKFTNNNDTNDTNDTNDGVCNSDSINGDDNNNTTNNNNNNKHYDIVVIDFGGCVYNKLVHQFINQTRYYRAPEVILDGIISPAIDIWSIGCMIIEIIKDNLLFNPDDKGYNRDLLHLEMIQRYFGKIRYDKYNNIDLYNDLQNLSYVEYPFKLIYPDLQIISPLLQPNYSDRCDINYCIKYIPDIFYLINK